MVISQFNPLGYGAGGLDNEKVMEAKNEFNSILY